MMPQRRRMMMTASQNKSLWLYKDGVTTEGYSFSSGLNSYGGTKTGTFTNADGQLKCYVYDGTSATFGCAMAETTGLWRPVLEQYKRICFTAMCSPDYPLSVQYQHVGVYSDDFPNISNALTVETPPFEEYGKVSIDIADLIANNPDTTMFYIGAGVLTVASMAYGAVYVSIKEIWLE